MTMFQGEPDRPVRCSVESSSELVCKTPEIAAPENEVEDYETYGNRGSNKLLILLGVGDDVLNKSTKIRKTFFIYRNPIVDEWDSCRSFKIYEGEKHIRITVTVLLTLEPCS